jgi:IS5 family transposase
MKKQQTFTDIEYSCRKKKTRREEFLETMDEIILWDEWVGIIAPYYPSGKRGRPPMGIERMLRMYPCCRSGSISLTQPLRMQYN